MKTSIVVLIFAAFLVSGLLSSCIAPREISTTACNDSTYLALDRKPIDSMTPREFAYWQTKDKECEDAIAAANAVHQTQVGNQENVILGIVVLVALLLLGSLSSNGSVL